MEFRFAGLCAFTALFSLTAAAPAATTKLERVVMLMRHGIRPPTKAQPIPQQYSPDRWPGWQVEPGLLTSRGAAGVALLGTADRAYLIKEGVLPRTGCTPAGIDVHASSKPRAIRTAEEWAKTFAPGCTIEVSHPADGQPDPIFHGLDDSPASFDGHRAYAEALAQAPAGGLDAEARLHAPEIRLLEQVLGCREPTCDLESVPTVLTEQQHDRPELEGPLDIGSTASQTFLLEYLEGMPMEDVGWGRVSRDQIETLLSFHPVKFKYNNRPGYIARAAAEPLIRTMAASLNAPKGSPSVTVLAGHDTNIADLAGLLDLHWRVPSYPADDVPPGAAVGFELSSNSAGSLFVRAFVRAQTMDQLRNQRPLDGETGPYRAYIDIPGCGRAMAQTGCSLTRFNALIEERLAASD